MLLVVCETGSIFSSGANSVQAAEGWSWRLLFFLCALVCIRVCMNVCICVYLCICISVYVYVHVSVEVNNEGVGVEKPELQLGKGKCCLQIPFHHPLLFYELEYLNSNGVQPSTNS